MEEKFALAGEEAIGGKACDRSHGARKFIGQRTNDRDMGGVGAEEFARDGEEGGKRQLRDGIREGRHGLLYTVAGEVDPFEEVGDLVTTNTEGDLKDFRI